MSSSPGSVIIRRIKNMWFNIVSIRDAYSYLLTLHVLDS